MRQAIVTRFLGPTNTKGSRVVATAQAGRLIRSWEYEYDDIANHHNAAAELAERYGWKFRRTGKPDECLHGGYLPDGSIVWVLP